MQQVRYKNIFNGEEFICNNPYKDEQIIEGVKYLIVRRNDNPRTFLMRKDALQKIKSKNEHRN